MAWKTSNLMQMYRFLLLAILFLPHEMTIPPLLSGNDFQTAEEGSDVKLVCNVKSNPQAQMMWYKNSGVLNLEKNHHQLQQTSEYLQLSITKVKKSDNGTYSCIANSLMETKTKDFHLIVK
ncbi:Transmembrane and immunoglobulin domain-containing protein 1, partial [Eschrichtius robustus]|nr:Transmembrane and immunoglobulin domain-containing protein 1 [Eschrichtius robustus]